MNTRCALAALLLLPLAADAKLVAEAPMSGGAVVLLHDEPGPCVGDALLAEHIDEGGRRTPGCWVDRGDRILIVFLDGDVGGIPKAMLRAPKIT